MVEKVDNVVGTVVSMGLVLLYAWSLIIIFGGGGYALYHWFVV